jgi:hypothetical protein
MKLDAANLDLENGGSARIPSPLTTHLVEGNCGIGGRRHYGGDRTRGWNIHSIRGRLLSRQWLGCQVVDGRAVGPRGALENRFRRHVVHRAKYYVVMHSGFNGKTWAELESVVLDSI